jgi:hypothetical protein
MMENMTSTQLESTLRYLIATFGAYAAGKGWISPGTIIELTPLLVSVGALAWGLWVNHTKAKSAAVREVVAVRVGAAAQANPAIPMSSPENIGAAEAKDLIKAMAPTVVSSTPAA